MIGPNKGNFPLFGSKFRNSSNKGMHKNPLFYEKIFQNSLVLVGSQPFSEDIWSNNQLESFLERSYA